MRWCTPASARWPITFSPVRGSANAYRLLKGVRLPPPYASPPSFKRLVFQTNLTQIANESSPRWQSDPQPSSQRLRYDESFTALRCVTVSGRRASEEALHRGAM